MPKPEEFSVRGPGSQNPDSIQHESIEAQNLPLDTSIALGGKVIHQAPHEKSGLTLREGIASKGLGADFMQSNRDLIERTKNSRARLENIIAHGERVLAKSDETINISRLTSKANFVFGKTGLNKELRSKSSLKDEILNLHYMRDIPLSRLIDILDDLHRQNNKDDDALNVEDALNILDKLDPLMKDSMANKDRIESGFSLGRQEQTANTERGELSSRLETLSKYVLLNPKINEFSSKEMIIKEMTSYMRTNNATQAQIDSIQAKLSAFSETDAPIMRVKILLISVREAVRMTDDRAYEGIARTEFTINKGAIKGKGGVGIVYDATLDGNPKLLKLFNSMTFPICLDHTTDPSNPSLLRSQELTASYLNSRELETIVAPTHYLVTEKRPGEPDITHLVEVKDKEFRGWAKHKLISNWESPGYSLEITGSLQNYAKGIELFEYLKNKPRSEIQANAQSICISYLDALQVLCERGFVHGDLKTLNAFYDPSTQKISIIDTGGLVKISKTKDRQENTKFNFMRAFTPHYSAPNIFRKKNLGFEQDLFSTGLQMLEVIGRTNFSNASKCAKIRNELRATYEQALAKTKPLSRAQDEMLKIALDGLTSMSLDPKVTEEEGLEAAALICVIVPMKKEHSLLDRAGQISVIESLKTSPLSARKRIIQRYATSP